MGNLRAKILALATTLFILASILPAINPAAEASPERLIILSPHSKPFFDLVVRRFKDHYRRETGKDVIIIQDFKYSGLCAEAVFKAKGAPAPDEAVWWGGGMFYFDGQMDYLEPYKSKEDANINATYYMWPLKRVKDGQYLWYASALSTFGIIINEAVLKAAKLPVPMKWDDLRDPKYRGKIVMANPQLSGSTLESVMQQVQLRGWDGGWAYWLAVAANMKEFTPASHDVPKKVKLGEYPLGLAIDYYAAEYGLKYTIAGASICSPDPVALLKNADPKALEIGKMFIDWLLSKEGQEATVAGGRLPVRGDIVVPPPMENPWVRSVVIPGYNITLADLVKDLVAGLFYNWIIVNHAYVKDALDSLARANETMARFRPVPREAEEAYLSASRKLFTPPITKADAERHGKKWTPGPAFDQAFIMRQAGEWQEYGKRNLSEAIALSLRSETIARQGTAIGILAATREAIRKASGEAASYISLASGFAAITIILMLATAFVALRRPKT